MNCEQNAFGGQRGDGCGLAALLSANHAGIASNHPSPIAFQIALPVSLSGRDRCTQILPSLSSLVREHIVADTRHRGAENTRLDHLGFASVLTSSNKSWAHIRCSEQVHSAALRAPKKDVAAGNPQRQSQPSCSTMCEKPRKNCHEHT